MRLRRYYNDLLDTVMAVGYQEMILFSTPPVKRANKNL